MIPERVDFAVTVPCYLFLRFTEVADIALMFVSFWPNFHHPYWVSKTPQREHSITTYERSLLCKYETGFYRFG
jgi:hypothetical protein